MAAETKTDVQRVLWQTEDKIKALEKSKSILDRNIRLAESDLLDTADPDVRQVKRDQLKSQLTERARLDASIHKKKATKSALENENRRKWAEIIFTIVLVLVLGYFGIDTKN